MSAADFSCHLEKSELGHTHWLDRTARLSSLPARLSSCEEQDQCSHHPFQTNHPDSISSFKISTLSLSKTTCSAPLKDGPGLSSTYQTRYGTLILLDHSTALSMTRPGPILFISDKPLRLERLHLIRAHEHLTCACGTI